MKYLIIVLGMITILTGCNNHAQSYQWTQNKLIAHAAGGIDEHHYSNSLEAFQESYKEGYKLIEVDISITSDNHLVIRHGWQKDYGQKLDNDGLPTTYSKFMTHPIYGKYTPMDFNMLLDLLKKYPDIHVILDGKVTSVDDTKHLYKKIGDATKNLPKNILDRLIPQMFYKDDLKIIRNYGFHDVVYVVGREKYTAESVTKFCTENDIRVVSLSRSRTTEQFLHTLSQKDIVAYLYTVNDANEMKKYEHIGVNGFFTDFVTNNDLE